MISHERYQLEKDVCMTKANYKAIQLWVTGDADFRLQIKEKAAQAKMDVQDYIRNVLNIAIQHEPSSFFAECGNDHNHSETDMQ